MTKQCSKAYSESYWRLAFKVPSLKPSKPSPVLSKLQTQQVGLPMTIGMAASFPTVDCPRFTCIGILLL